MEWIAKFGGYIATLAVGGFGVALFNAWHTRSDQRIARRVEFISKQLERLYGPMNFLCGNNLAMFDFDIKLDSAYTNEFIGKAGRGDEAAAVIDVRNEYSRKTTDNNRRIAELMQAEYALIDSQDIDAFQHFVLRKIRYEVEFAKGRWALPTMMLSHVGPVTSFSREFSERIATRFAEKQRELASLRNRSSVWSCRQSRSTDS